jgi:hypothetical protein
LERLLSLWAGTYTCDSPGLTSARAAEQAQAETLREIAACFGDSWTEAHERSSANYVALHSRAAPLSITLSTDQSEKGGHVVRLILFVRRNQVGNGRIDHCADGKHRWAPGCADAGCWAEQEV